MGASAIISHSDTSKVIWTVGSSAFLAIIGRIKDLYTARSTTPPVGLFDLAEQTDILDLDELSAKDFAQFVEQSAEAFSQLHDDDRYSARDREWLATPWEEFLSLLKQDNRWVNRPDKR
jgi:hypothetical protein